ncbi:MAG: hypothetical protein J7K23_00525, partial [Thermoproteales archaeon]|nr:hypothetical protein [Thermoproteales archaeon]
MHEEFIRNSLKEAKKIGRELRRTKIDDTKISNVIIKYLIYNSWKPEKCSLRNIERELELPYSRVRKIIGILANDNILQVIKSGKSEIIKITDLEKAFIKGYIYV